jgi:DnaJ-class molecular chaperone
MHKRALGYTTCDDCSGTGKRPSGETCKTCEGSGLVLVVQGETGSKDTGTG